MTTRDREPDDGTDFPHAAGRPARRALRAAGYTRLDELASVSDAELLALHGVGPRAIRAIREALAARGRDPAG